MNIIFQHAWYYVRHILTVTSKLYLVKSITPYVQAYLGFSTSAQPLMYGICSLRIISKAIESMEPMATICFLQSHLRDRRIFVFTTNTLLHQIKEISFDWAYKLMILHFLIECDRSE
jgi:hypothetical protein